MSSQSKSSSPTAKKSESKSTRPSPSSSTRPSPSSSTSSSRPLQSKLKPNSNSNSKSTTLAKPPLSTSTSSKVKLPLHIKSAPAPLQQSTRTSLLSNIEKNLRSRTSQSTSNTVSDSVKKENGHGYERTKIQFLSALNLGEYKRALALVREILVVDGGNKMFIEYEYSLAGIVADMESDDDSEESESGDDSDSESSSSSSEESESENEAKRSESESEKKDDEDDSHGMMPPPLPREKQEKLNELRSEFSQLRAYVADCNEKEKELWGKEGRSYVDYDDDHEGSSGGNRNYDRRDDRRGEGKE